IMGSSMTGAVYAQSAPPAANRRALPPQPPAADNAADTTAEAVQPTPEVPGHRIIGNRINAQHAQALGQYHRAIEKHDAATAAYQYAPAKMEKAPFLGISASPLPAVLREQLKLPRGIGMVVDHVDANSPAEAAGVKQYDFLYKL